MAESLAVAYGEGGVGRGGNIDFVSTEVFLPQADDPYRSILASRACKNDYARWSRPRASPQESQLKAEPAGSPTREMQRFAIS